MSCAVLERKWLHSLLLAHHRSPWFTLPWSLSPPSILSSSSSLYPTHQRWWICSSPAWQHCSTSLGWEGKAFWMYIFFLLLLFLFFSFFYLYFCRLSSIPSPSFFFRPHTLPVPASDWMLIRWASLCKLLPCIEGLFRSKDKSITLFVFANQKSHQYCFSHIYNFISRQRPKLYPGILYLSPQYRFLDMRHVLNVFLSCSVAESTECENLLYIFHSSFF